MEIKKQKWNSIQKYLSQKEKKKKKKVGPLQNDTQN